MLKIIQRLKLIRYQSSQANLVVWNPRASNQITLRKPKTRTVMI